MPHTTRYISAGILRHALEAAKPPRPHTLRPVNARCMRLPTFSLKGNTYFIRHRICTTARLYLPACTLLRSISSDRMSHILFAILSHPKSSRCIIPLTAATSLPASGGRIRRFLRPKSGKRNRSETIFTVHYLLTENAAKRSPQPSPANTIHHARYASLHPRPYRHSAQTTQRRAIPHTQRPPNTQKAGEEDPLRLLLTGDVVPNYFTGSSCTVK